MNGPKDTYDKLLRAAWHLHSKHRYQEAAQVLERARDVDPHNPEVYYRLGLAKERMGDLRGAERDYARSSALDPDSARAEVALARLFSVRGEEASRDAALKSAVAKPNGPDRQIALGQIASFDGRYADALEHYRYALEWNVDDARLQHFMGHVLLQMGRFGEAAEYLRRSVQAEPYAGAFLTLGIAEQRLRHYRAAHEAYAAAVALDPDNYRAYIALSCLEAKRGSLLAAWRHFREAIRVSPYG